MANQILRPDGIGHYNAWSGISGGGSYTPLYDLVKEADADGDATYVTASAAGAATFACSDAVATAWPRATRIRSIRVVATVRTTGTESVYRLRLRILGNDYDSADRAVNVSSKYVEQDEVYVLTPNAYAWDLTTLNQMEAGLVFGSGDPIRCTKLEVFLHYEPFPHHTLAPEGNGVQQQWSPNPSGSPAYMTVGGVFDGDLSYLEDQTVNNQSTFETTDLPVSLSPANIDRVSVKGLVKNVGTQAEHADILVYSGGLYFHGGTSTTSLSIPTDDEWHLLTEDYLNDPGTVWPSGDPAASAWSSTEVNGIEVGVENSGGGDLRCTSLAAEVWLAATPPTTIDLLPSADGYHQDWTNIVPSAPAWGTVDEDPPDDITSYVSLDADTAETPVYASFDVAGAGSVPATERIHNVELRCRVRLDNLPHSRATVVPVMRDTSGTPETFVGKPQLIEGIGSTWIDVKWDFHNNPHTGAPWTNLAEVNTAMEYGMGVLDGQMLLSRVRAQVQTTTDYRGVSDVTDLRITDEGEYWMNRAKADGTIYGYWEFAVGIGGYDVTDPTTVTAVNPADTGLLNEVYRTGVGRIEFDSLASSPTVDFWCRVPQDRAIGGIGEIALYAQILWSPVPAEIGTWFCYAIAHMPCQTRTQHWSSVHFYRLQVEHHDYGANLMVDGDQEAATAAAYTATAATLSKQTTDPAVGLQLLRVEQTGAGTATASQAIVTIGQLYLIHDQARSDGTDTPSIQNPSGTDIWTGTTATAWQEANFLHHAIGDTSIWLAASGGVATNYCEFDDVQVREVLSYDFLTHGAELVVDNDMEQAGIGAWTESTLGVLSKDPTDPYEGTQCLRVQRNGVNNPYAEQTVLVIGTIYHAIGRVRSDGIYTSAVYDGATLLWTGTTDTAWRFFEVAFTATSTDIRYQANVTAGTNYCEFDVVSVKAITAP